VAAAHHSGNGNVFDEWVLNCRGASHSPRKRGTGEGFYPLTYFPFWSRFLGLVFKEFSNSFFSPDNGYTNRGKMTALHACDLLVCKAKLVIQNKSPPLGFGQLLNGLPERFVLQSIKGCFLNAPLWIKHPLVEFRVRQVGVFPVPFVPMA
jgi:hypothetical protein